MSPLLLVAIVGGVAVIAAGAGGTPQRTPTKAPKAPPQPPKPPQGDTGPLPDPKAPNDPNRGRFFTTWGVPFSDLKTMVHEAQILRLANNAGDFTIVVDGWFNNTKDQTRCAAIRWRLDIENGRLARPPIMNQGNVADLPKCPANSKPLKQGMPFSGPKMLWAQQGRWILFRWETLGFGETEDNAPWFSPEEAGATGFYVDLVWRVVA